MADKSIDLVGTGCPMNLVYTKVELAKLNQGEVLEIILDDGAPVRNVSRSVQDEGHELINKEQRTDGNWAVTVKKG